MVSDIQNSEYSDGKVLPFLGWRCGSSGRVPALYKALSSNPSFTKKKKKKSPMLEVLPFLKEIFLITTIK
jgi:hypothetical protein